MIRQDSYLAEENMHFDSDKNKFSGKIKSERSKKDRKNEREIIKKILENK